MFVPQYAARVLNERRYSAVSIEQTEETRNGTNILKKVFSSVIQNNFYTQKKPLHRPPHPPRSLCGYQICSSSAFPALRDKAETSAFISAASLTASFKINHPV